MSATKTASQNAAEVLSTMAPPIPDAAAPALDLAALAIHANASHAVIAQNDVNSLFHARAAGEHVQKVFENRSWTGYQEWVRDHLKFSFSSANLYRKIFVNWEKVKGAASIVEARKLMTKSRQKKEVALTEWEVELQQKAKKYKLSVDVKKLAAFLKGEFDIERA